MHVDICPRDQRQHDQINQQTGGHKAILNCKRCLKTNTTPMKERKEKKEIIKLIQHITHVKKGAILSLWSL